MLVKKSKRAAGTQRVPAFLPLEGFQGLKGLPEKGWDVLEREVGSLPEEVLWHVARGA